MSLNDYMKQFKIKNKNIMKYNNNVIYYFKKIEI